MPSFPERPIPVITSQYMDVNRFIRRWGYLNVAKHTNKDGGSSSQNPVIDAAALQDAYDYAEESMNAAMRGGVYMTPLTFTGPIPLTIDNWTSVLTYCNIYFTRVIENTDKVAKELDKICQSVYSDISLYRSGMKMFDTESGVSYDDSGGQDRSMTPVYPEDVI